jgi:pimeloyl-ACP methyl ester carboxylesterase
MATMFRASLMAFVILLAGSAAQAEEENGVHASLSGVNMWYTDSGGSGVPIVLLHAKTGTSAYWLKQSEAFGHAGYRVIAFDRRGWGKSIADPSTGPQPGTIADDLDALATYLKLDKFFLLGTAGGSVAALDYAAWHQERLRGLIIAASTGSFSATGSVPRARATRPLSTRSCEPGTTPRSGGRGAKRPP